MLKVKADGSLMSIKSKGDTTRFMWTTANNNMIDSMPASDPRRQHLVAYRDALGFIAELHPWKDVMEFDLEVKKLLTAGVKIELNLVALQSTFLMLQSSKRFKHPAPFNAVGGKEKKSGTCSFFNQKDGQTGKHKCVRHQCSFAHKCGKCGSAAHSSFACNK